MLTIGNYVKAKTPEEAYELNQARSSRIMGGMMWMRLSNARVKTLIDISGLGLDQIEETEDEIRIGAMCTLRQIEQSEAVKKLCGDGIEEAVRHIVGVQFRNQATVGGSIYGRFGFSDVLTAFLALDTYVELYDGGRICLAEFAKKKPDNDLLLFIVVKTDFPVIACSVSREKANGQETWYFAVGARPMKADMIEKKWSVAKDASLEKIEEYAALAAAEFKYGTNMRGSAGYRQHLAKVLIKREIMSILSEEI